MIFLLALLGLGIFLIRTPLYLITRFFGWIFVGYAALLILKLLT